MNLSSISLAVVRAGSSTETPASTGNLLADGFPILIDGFSIVFS